MKIVGVIPTIIKVLVFYKRINIIVRQFSLPFKNFSSIKNCIETTSPPNFSTSLAAASIVPPVANKSSTIATF